MANTKIPVELSSTPGIVDNSNATAITIDSSERVGIGTASPTRTFEVNSGATNVVARFESTDSRAVVELKDPSGSAELGGIGSDIYFAPAGVEKVRIESSGNVGIGTSSPQTDLNIVNSSGATLDISTNLGAADSKILLHEGTSASPANGASIRYDGANNLFKIGVGSSVDNTIITIPRDSGNVGIGTTSPSATLDLTSASSDAVFLRSSNATTSNVYITNTNATTGNTANLYFAPANNIAGSQISSIAIEDFSVSANRTADLAFSTRLNGTMSERMRIESDGSLLVGNTTNNSTIFRDHVIQGNGDSAGIAAIGLYNEAGTANTPVVAIASRDTSTNSTVRFIQFWNNVTTTTENAMGGIVGNGSSNVAFATLSDEREKENITPVVGALDKLMNLNVVSFDWKKHDDHVEAGFIAQNVEEYFPEYVVENMSREGEESRKGTTGGMSQGYIAVLTKAIQEQQTQIEALQFEINLLKGE
jgi:hypothetical protein